MFYLLTVADSARNLFFWFGILFTVISVISTIWFIVDRDGNDLSVQSGSAAERAKKWMWWSYPFTLILLMLWTLTPSKRDALLIIAGGETMNFLTTDKTAKQIPHELSNFVVTEIKNMAKEADVELNIKEQKQKILDEAEKMSTKEILEKIKTDSTFAKIVLEK